MTTIAKAADDLSKVKTRITNIRNADEEAKNEMLATLTDLHTKVGEVAELISAMAKLIETTFVAKAAALDEAMGMEEPKPLITEKERT